MASTIQVRVEDDLKTQSDKLFKELGIDTTTAIRLFLKQAVAYGGLPFPVRKRTSSIEPLEVMSGEQILAALARARENVDNGNYVEAESFMSDMRKKYGL